MRWLLAFTAAFIATAMPLGAEARACFYTGVVGQERMSARALARERDRALRQRTRWRGERARAALARGADPAALLAEMLVPNVRPVRIERSDCGPENEIDVADGEEKPEDWVAGTRYAGQIPDVAGFWDMYEDPGLSRGATCNAELRAGFGGHLPPRLAPGELEAAYLFLAARWNGTDGPDAIRSRLTAFERQTRRPPVRWSSTYWREIAQWAERDPAGMAIMRVSGDFWRETEPLLGDDARICPEAAARWPAVQARVVALLDARERWLRGGDRQR